MKNKKEHFSAFSHAFAKLFIECGCVWYSSTYIHYQISQVPAAIVAQMYPPSSYITFRANAWILRTFSHRAILPVYACAYLTRIYEKNFL